MSLLQGRLGLLISATTVGGTAIIAFRIIVGRVVTAFFYALAINVIVMTIWDIFIWPFFLNPFRHLPTVRDGFYANYMSHPRGKNSLLWFQNTPNDGLIHVRAGLNHSALLVTSQEAVRDVLITNCYDFAKPSGFSASLSRILGYGLLVSEGDVHKAQRKALSPAFSTKKIRTSYPLIWGKVQAFLHHLEQEVQANPAPGRKTHQMTGFVEMRGWAHLILASHDLNCLENKYNPVSHSLEIITSSIAERSVAVVASMLLPQFLTKIIPCQTTIFDIPRFRDALAKFSSDILHEKRLKPQVERADYDTVDTMMHSAGLSDTELQDQLITLLSAGYETTPGAIDWCCYHLSQEPRIQSILRNEIRTFIPSPLGRVSWKEFESMPYLNGVCEEILRLYPVASVLGRESIRETVIAGHDIPAGTVIGIFPYAINRSREFWGETAEQFRPERWIDRDDKTGKETPNRNGGTRKRYGQMTFLHGPKSCIGKDIAKAELRCVVAGIFGRFQIERKDNGHEVRIGGALTSQPEDMHLKLSMVPGWN